MLLFRKKPDFEELIDLTLPGLKSAYTAAMEIIGAEKVYAVVLTTYSSCEGFGLHLNTEENFQRILDQADISEKTRANSMSSDLNYYRWYWGEWGPYEYIGDQEELTPAYAWLTEKRSKVKNFAPFKKSVHQTMIELLKRLDADGIFGTEEERETILCYAGVYDDDEDIIFQSAKTVNSQKNWQKWEPFLKAGL